MDIRDRGEGSRRRTKRINTILGLRTWATESTTQEAGRLQWYCDIVTVSFVRYHLFAVASAKARLLAIVFGPSFRLFTHATVPLFDITFSFHVHKLSQQLVSNSIDAAIRSRKHLWQRGL